MNKYLVTAALLTIPLGAQAADLPAKAPYLKAPIMQVYNWSGLYVGVNAGFGVGRTGSTFNVGPPAFVSENTNLSPFGAIGGGQIGYNWQFGQYLLGLETDLQGAGLRDSRTCILGCVPGLGANLTQSIDWLGTARVRAGLVTGSMVTYVTGGLAYGGVKNNLSVIEGPNAAAFSNSSTRTGWTIGSGVEAALGGNWTGKIEYLYVDLGSQTTNFVLGGLPQSSNSKVRENIFRVGLNYRIGGVGAIEPTANWSGFYLGGNGGSGIARNRSANVISVAPPTPALAEQFNMVPDGYNGGVQAGYNWQAGNVVYGVETDFQGAWQKDSKTCLGLCSPVLGSTTFNQKIEWFGTVRGRLGYAVGSSLFYATGGYAYGNVKTQINVIHPGIVPTSADLKHTKGGWTVGAGLETPFELFGLFGRNWTSKTEYLYVDLGSATDSYAAGGVTHTFTTRVQEHVFRTGLNYHFNAPVVAKY